MEKYIKYKRIDRNFRLNNIGEYEIQEFFDKLITDGWEIIHYQEKEKKSDNPDTTSTLRIITVVGKRQNNNL